MEQAKKTEENNPLLEKSRRVFEGLADISASLRPMSKDIEALKRRHSSEALRYVTFEMDDGSQFDVIMLDAPAVGYYGSYAGTYNLGEWDDETDTQL